MHRWYMMCPSFNINLLEKNLHSLKVFSTSHIYEVFLPSSKSFISTFTPRYGPKREFIGIFFVVKTPIPASGIIEGFT